VNFGALCEAEAQALAGCSVEWLNWLNSNFRPSKSLGMTEILAALAATGIMVMNKFPNDFEKNAGAEWAGSDRGDRGARGATQWKPADRST
jgi:hypothetical protein